MTIENPVSPTIDHGSFTPAAEVETKPMETKVTKSEPRSRLMIETTRRGELPCGALLFTVSGDVGYGQLETGLYLGYENKKVISRTNPHEFISAHAPSVLTLMAKSPLTLWGFISGTAKRDASNPCEFWIDQNYVGSAVGPCDETRPMHLEPGEHVLQITTEKSTADWRHSCWAVEEANPAAEPPMAVITIAGYPQARAPKEIRYLAYSARKLDIPLVVRGVNEDYRHYESKIERLHEWITQLPASVETILYCDGRDTLLVDDLETICRKFREIGQPLVIGAEKGCWPVHDPVWREKFPKHSEGRSWINAGMFMGERRALTEALAKLKQLNADLGAETAPAYLADVWKWRGTRFDDQWLWQVAELLNLFPLTVDRDCAMFANVSTQDRTLGPENKDYAFYNKDYRYSAATGGVTMKCNPRMVPSVLHFSGDASWHELERWAGYLRLV
jgi:hypothetical protein